MKRWNVKRSSGRKRMASLGLALTAVWSGLAWGACEGGDSEALPSVAAPPGEITAAELRNMAYPTQHLPEGVVRLTAGVYEDPERRLIVRLLPEYAVGDMNGDGTSDAAVLLSTSAGGSGVFQDLALVLNAPGDTARSVRTTFLGDREPVDRIRIADAEVSLDILEHGPGDPMFCPTQSVTRRYRLEAGELVPVSAAGDDGRGPP